MKKYYGSADGLRTIACIGIVMMHVAENSTYSIQGYLYDTIIPSFTDFVFLFMMLSAFGMCCGYYNKMLSGKISLSEFYGRRFKKIFPFFAVLVLLDVVMSPSAGSFCEGFADLTLMFGFLPNPRSIAVIGVGWFLGLIFVFYICFPFFCVLIENGRRAWTVFGLSVVWHFMCLYYFGASRANVLYSACFFLAGGMIYLYREQIERWNKWAAAGLVLSAAVVYYVIGRNTAACLVLSAAFLIYAVSDQGKLLNNRITKFIGGISMELYLSHMVAFRLAEKLKLTSALGDGWEQYIFSVIIVLCGAAVFSLVLQKSLKKLGKKVSVTGRKITGQEER